MTNQELYPPTETTKERFSSWRKPLAVTAMGIAALSACSSDVEAQPTSTEPTDSMTEPIITGQEHPEDGWDPYLEDGPDVANGWFGEAESAELMERMGFPLEQCDEVAEGEICVTGEAKREEGSSVTIMQTVHNADHIVTEWAREQGLDRYEYIFGVYHLPAELTAGVGPNRGEYDSINVMIPGYNLVEEFEEFEQ